MLSTVLGWAYVACWGASLYPPVLLNRQLKSVEGMSLDFTLINLMGCVFYFISVCMLRYSKVVRAEYALRHDMKMPLVQFNDVVYGTHSIILLLVALYQFYFAGYKRLATQHISTITKAVSGLGCLMAVLMLLHAWEISTTRRHYELVDVALIFGFVKVALGCIKYVPQAYHNYRRRSTHGFAISSVISDIFGALFCLAQLFLDAYIAKEYGGIFQPPTKLLLGLVVLFFGFVFIIQHRIYRDKPLLGYEK